MSGFFMSMLSGAFNLPNYLYKRDVTLDNRGTNETIANVQVKVILTSSNFDFSKAKSNGADIRFVQGNSILEYYIESYNNGGQTGVLFVKVPTINTASYNTISMYYGNTSAITASSFAAMQRFENNRYGGDTKYLLRLEEGSGTTSANADSIGGNVTVPNSWSSNNALGFAGNAASFNGTSNAINISGLLDTYPVAGEISLVFKANTVTGNKRILSKYNRLGTTAPDYGDYMNLFIYDVDGKLYFQSAVGSSQSTILKTPFVIVANTTYKVTIIWANGAVGLYVNGVLADRNIFYKANGSIGAFKIGCLSDSFSGASNLFFDGLINDFRYTDYTAGQIPSLVHVEAEHNYNRFFIKDKRTKFNGRKELITTNFPSGTFAQYKAEPFGFFDNGKYKLIYSCGDSYLRYRESNTPFGLKNSTDVLILGAGTGGESGDPSLHSLYIEGGVYYLYYALGATGSIYLVTSTDGINYSNKQTVLTKPASGWGSLGLVNTWVVKVGSTYHMFVEANDAALVWSTGRATATSPNGPFTIQDTSINAFKIGGTGSSGGYTGWYDGTRFNIFYHANPTPSFVYDQTYFTSTSDLVTYVTEQTPTIKIVDEITAYDQTADITIFTDGSKVYFDYSALDNRTPFFAGIIRCEFNGNYTQLLQDFTIQIGNEQLL